MGRSPQRVALNQVATVVLVSNDLLADQGDFLPEAHLILDACSRGEQGEQA